MSVHARIPDLQGAGQSGSSLPLTDTQLSATAPHFSEGFVRNVLNSLSAHVAVLDENGVIVAVNESWRRFAAENGGRERQCLPGASYFAVCDSVQDETAAAAVRGIRAVLSGAVTDFSLEYPCHSPGELRWFHLKVVPLSGGSKGVVTTHENITAIIQSEQLARQTSVRMCREAAAVSAIAASHKLSEGAVPELATELTELAAAVLEVARVGVWLFAEGGAELVNIDTYQADGSKHSSGAALREQEFCNEFAALRRAKFVDAHDALTDPRTAGYVEGYLKPLRIRSMLDAVIRAGDRILGVLCFEQADQLHHWDHHEISFACQLADHVALAILNRERNRMKADLAEKEETLRSLFNAIKESVFLLKSDGIILAANETFAQRLGKTVADCVGQSTYGLIPASVAASRREIVEAVVRTGKPAEFEDERLGRWLHHSIMPVLRLDGTVDRLAVFGQDITQRKQAEATLRESELRHRLVADFTHGWEYWLAPDGNLLYVSPACERITGYRAEAFLRDPGLMLRIVHPEDRARVAEHLCNHRETADPELHPNFDFRILTRGGEIRWIGHICRRIHGSNGEFLGRRGSNRDITAHRRAEEALRRSEELFRKMFDDHAAIKLVINPSNGDIINANKAAATFYGWSVVQLRQMRIQQINTLPQEDLKKELLKARKAQEKHFRFCHRRSDGSVRDVEVYSNLIETEGRLLLYSIIHDITDRKRAEESLKESEKQFRTLFENAPVGIAVTNLEGTLLAYNDALLGPGGYLREDFKRFSTVAALYHDPEQRKEVLAILNRRRVVERYLVQLNRKDGSFYEALVSLIHSTFDGETCIQETIEDISDLRRLERELRRNAGRLRAIVEAEPECVKVVSPAGDLLEMNPAGLKMIEAESLAQAQSQPLIQFVLPEYQDGFRSALRRVIQGQSVEFQFEVIGLKGGRRWLDTHAVPLRDPENSLPNLLSVTRDITERKRAEAEKERMEAQNRQLQKSESLGRMAGAIAHHYNNQLQAVLLGLELSMDDLDRVSAGVEAIEGLAHVRESVRELVELGGAMLLYVGLTHVKNQPLDLSAVCREHLPVLHAILPKVRTLDTELPVPGPIIQGNVSQLKQVLTNLVTNAVEAVTEANGAICLAVKTVLATDIPTKNRFPIDYQPHSGAYACLLVADTGCGIPEKNVESIFDPFFSSKLPGRGLGLAVALGIIREHHGVITVRSLPEHGSTFQVFLPITAPGPPREGTVRARAD